MTWPIPFQRVPDPLCTSGISHPLHEPHVRVSLGQSEVGDSLLVKAQVPPDRDVILSLGLFQFLIVVGLQLDQRAEYVLVLVGILVPQEDMLRLLVHAWLLQVLQSGKDFPSRAPPAC